jgi:hypothetical protein
VVGVEGVGVLPAASMVCPLRFCVQAALPGGGAIT